MYAESMPSACLMKDAGDHHHWDLVCRWPPGSLTPGTTAPTVVQEVDHAAGAAGTSASVPPASTKAGDLLVLSVTMDAGSGSP